LKNFPGKYFQADAKKYFPSWNIDMFCVLKNQEISHSSEKLS
jgi:hypothetical protein